MKDHAIVVVVFILLIIIGAHLVRQSREDKIRSEENHNGD